MFYVETGHVRLDLPLASGARRVAGLVGPGELFGFEALFESSRRRFGCSAGEPVTARALPGPRVLRALQGTRWTLAKVLDDLSREVALSRAAAGRASTTESRAAQAFLDLSQRFGEPKASGEIRVPRWFTHGELAELIGAHRSTVTTLLNGWIYDRLVAEEQGAFVIKDRAGLSARAGLPDVDPSPGSA